MPKYILNNIDLTSVRVIRESVHCSEKDAKQLIVEKNYLTPVSKG